MPQPQHSSPPPHALILPAPAQGHVIPLIKLAHRLVSEGFLVTFVNTEFNHYLITAAAESDPVSGGGGIRLVSLPDGLAPGVVPTGVAHLMGTIGRTMPARLEELVSGMAEEVTCMIVDFVMSWGIGVGAKLGIPTGIFCPVSVAVLASVMSVPRLIEEGRIDETGQPTKEDSFQLAPAMVRMSPSNFTWCYMGGPEDGRVFLEAVLERNKYSHHVAFTLCNSFAEIEQPALDYAPYITPIGPLREEEGQSDHRLDGHFWAQDKTCAAWLDTQQDRSVVYVAFGSTTVFGFEQLCQLALGLELSGRPFLWVVRPDTTSGLMKWDNSDAEVDAFLAEFRERVGDRGRVVGWAPQEAVLGHSAVACFLTHCGWNSTMEAMWSGVPLLCWPYFTDQFLHRDYICDMWRVGLNLETNSDELLMKEEIKEKLDRLLEDEDLQNRMLDLKGQARKNIEGGASLKNLNNVINSLKNGSYLGAR